MANDIDEEMQADQIKTFWHAYKKFIIITLLLIVASYTGYQFYHSSEIKSAESASQLYQEVIIEKLDNVETIKLKVKTLQENHTNTPYAGRASIYLSRILFEEKNNNEAMEALIWASENAKEKSIQSLAYYALSNSYLVTKEIDKAKIAAEKISTPGYVGLKNDLLGDIYLLMNDKDMARASFKSALAFYDNKSELAKVVQTKLDAIGQ